MDARAGSDDENRERQLDELLAIGAIYPEEFRAEDPRVAAYVAGEADTPPAQADVPRLAFELDSARVGTLRRGITVSALEVRPTDAPEVFRVRLRGGWVSTQAATGKAILEPVSGGDFALGSDGPGHPRGG